METSFRNPYGFAPPPRRDLKLRLRITTAISRWGLVIGPAQLGIYLVDLACPVPLQRELASILSTIAFFSFLCAPISLLALLWKPGRLTPTDWRLFGLGVGLLLLAYAIALFFGFPGT
ncbi:MAG: hypothetical protein H6839_06650 [Planctomycetes bacterium]|nr:hypothetical protein [Planctomycetota bacterium]